MQKLYQMKALSLGYKLRNDIFLSSPNKNYGKKFSEKILILPRKHILDREFFRTTIVFVVFKSKHMWQFNEAM